MLRGVQSDKPHVQASVPSSSHDRTAAPASRKPLEAAPSRRPEMLALPNYPAKPDMTLPRNSSLLSRRMDSLARLTHSSTREMKDGSRKKTLVTAVGFQRSSKTGDFRVAIAHNSSDDQQAIDDQARLTLVRDVVIGNSSARSTARQMTGTSGLPHRGADAVERLANDLRKLRSTYQGRDDARGGAPLKQVLHNLFGTPEAPAPVRTADLTLNSLRGTIHAESALLAQKVQGRIGVSKLSCGDCYEYAAERGRRDDLRGTHGEYFPGWRHPDTGAVSHKGQVTGASIFTEDSDSGAEASGPETSSRHRR